MRLHHDAVPTERDAPQVTPCGSFGRVSGLAGMVGMGVRMFLSHNATNGAPTGAAPAAAAAPAPAQAPAPPAVTQMPVAGAPAAGANAGDLMTLFSGIVQQAVGPIAQQVAGLAATVAGMTSPIPPTVTQTLPVTQGHGAQGNFPAPFVRQGENIMSSRGFQLTRLMGVQSGMLSRDSAKLELELGGRLRGFYGNSNTDVTQQGILAPFASSHICGFDTGLGLECRQMMNAGVAGAEQGEIMNLVRQMATRYQAVGLANNVTQSMAQWDETSYGAFMSGLLQGEIIDLMRPNLVFAQAGAREVTMPANGKLLMGRVVGATTAKWIGQDVTNRAPTESKPQFGGWLMVCKKLGAIVVAPNDILRFGSPAFEAFIRQDVATSFAHKEEEAFIKGLGGLEPKGLINYSGVGTYTAGIVGTDGNTFQPSDFDGMVSSLEELDLPVGDVTFLMRSKLQSRIKNIRVDAVTAADGAGAYLSVPDAVAMQQGMRQATMQGYRILKTSNVPKNRTKGSSSVLTMVIAGMFREFIIGRHGVMEVATSDSAGTAFEEDLSKWRFLEYVDGGPRRDDAFVVCDQLVGGYT